MAQTFITHNDSYNVDETFTDPLKVIGHVPNLVDHFANRIVTGNWPFAQDVFAGQKLFTGVQYCPHAHATIKSVDTSAAESMPGVKAVVTYREVPAPAMPRPTTGETSAEIIYQGMCVAAVAATDPFLARAAADAIKVEYDIHPFVVDMDKALEPGAPLAVNGSTSNSSTRVVFNNPSTPPATGPANVDDAMKTADVIIDNVIDNEKWFGTSWASYWSHNTPEPRSATVKWVGGELWVWSGSQNIANHITNISRNMGLNESNVHFISKGCGGAYGDRKPNGEEAWIAALLSKKARMPVNCTFTRHVNATGGATHQGHQKSVIKLGCKRDGEVAAIDAHWYGTSGPIHLQLTYKTDYIRFTSTTVTINVPRTGPFRTVTGMHSCFCSDQIFDQMAYELNMDPYDFRMKVAVTPDRLDQATNRMNGSNALRDCLEEVGKIFDWKNKWAQHKAAGGVGKARLPDGRLWGIGSCYAFNEKGNSDNNRTVIIRVALDGSAHLNIGTGAASSGTHTAVAVVAAEALGTTIDRVNVTVGEAVLAGSGGNQAGSTGTMSNAYGAFEAAKKALGRMMANAATTLKTTTDQLVSENGRIFMKSDPTQFVTHAQAVGSLAIIESGNGAILGMNLKRDYLSWRRGQANTVRSSVADMCEIAVDEETGEIEILRWDMVDDVGRVLFPKGVQAQLNGGMVMKIGVALTGWEQLFDPGTGATLNGNFIDQKNPTPLDVPVDRITAVAYESNNAASVYGGIGCGEPPVLNYVVVHNAFYNATGKRLTNSVLYPARVLAALGKI